MPRGARQVQWTNISSDIEPFWYIKAQVSEPEFRAYVARFGLKKLEEGDPLRRRYSRARAPAWWDLPPLFSLDPPQIRDADVYGWTNSDDAFTFAEYHNGFMYVTSY